MGEIREEDHLCPSMEDASKVSTEEFKKEATEY